jgi:hypothetical protein
VTLGPGQRAHLGLGLGETAGASDRSLPLLHGERRIDRDFASAVREAGERRAPDLSERTSEACCASTPRQHASVSLPVMTHTMLRHGWILPWQGMGARPLDRRLVWCPRVGSATLHDRPIGLSARRRAAIVCCHPVVKVRPRAHASTWYAGGRHSEEGQRKAVMAGANQAGRSARRPRNRQADRDVESRLVRRLGRLDPRPASNASAFPLDPTRNKDTRWDYMIGFLLGRETACIHPETIEC